ncbi:MAG: RAMP superfamily CRISPR-associated protein [Nitrospirota bacterium]|nr:RAMP superfamily CRISPR-associated protein [Nitrospirota bacterium]
MLKKMINECNMTISLKSDSPWLIKDGRYEKNAFVKEMNLESRKKEYPDAVFICTDNDDVFGNAIKTKNYNSLNHYMPGTSLRGVFRSHTEKIAKTFLDGKDNYTICCDPFDKKLSCSNRLEKSKPLTPYKDSCLVCKLFGSTASGSRIEIGDAEITEKKVIIRDGIGIDRVTGAVKSGANFRFQLLENCKAEVKVRIRNFELWQLGLLAYVFQDLMDGYISVGFGTTKGYGKTLGERISIKLTYLGNINPAGEIKDVGALSSPIDIDKYCFIPGNLGKKEYLNPLADENLSIRKDYEITDVPQFIKDVAPEWNKALESALTLES